MGWSPLRKVPPGTSAKKFRPVGLVRPQSPPARLLDEKTRFSQKSPPEQNPPSTAVPACGAYTTATKQKWKQIQQPHVDVHEADVKKSCGPHGLHYMRKFDPAWAWMGG